MYNKLQQLGINIDEKQKILFSSFSDLFIEYNSKVNLISKNDINFLFQKHIFDSLAFNLFYKKYIDETFIKVMDIGTGGGFPSIPISLLYENIEVTALDSINKKINFIKTAADKLNIKNINPICSRAEELPVSMKNSFDVIVSRAMADLRIILEYAIPYLKTGGFFVAYKSQKAEEEICNAKNALLKLNSVVIDRLEYSLPIDEENKRVLLVIKKEKDISSIYPRKNGQIKKNPL